MNIESKKSLMLVAAFYFAVNLQAQERKDTVVKERRIDEIVLIGYGGVKKSNLTSAVSTIKASTFDDRPISNVAQAIQGNAAGVNVTQPSGKPGAALDVKIRGNTSITSNTSPLYVVDGVQTTDISGINTDDIVDMTILKDATSTAIYGVNGSSGVVIITTKRGRYGKGQLAFNAYWGFSKQVNAIKVLNLEQYKTLLGEIRPSYLNTANNPMYAGINTDWQKEVYQTGFDQNYNVNYSFGTDNVKIYTSLGYQGIRGIIRPSEFERFSGKVNLDAKFSSWLKFNTSLGYVKTDLNNTNDNLSTARGGVVLSALNTPSFLPVYGTDVKVIPTNSNGATLPGYLPGQFAPNPFQSGWENPLAYLNRINKTWNNRFMSNFGFDVQLAKNLTFKPSVSLDFVDTNTMGFVNAYQTVYGRQQQGLGNSSNNTWQNILYEATLNYAIKSGKNDFTFLLGANARDAKWINRTKSGRYFPEDLRTFDYNAATQKNYNYIARNLREVSGFARAIYTYDNKYTIMGIIKPQASSSLSNKNRWGYFPGASVAWTASNEDFLKDSKTISYLKIRGGWGEAGNAAGIPYYASYPLESIDDLSYDPVTGNPRGVWRQFQYGNSDLSWEVTTDINAGVDINFLDDKIRFTADFFHRKTRDLIMGITFGNTTYGFNSNIGTLENKGMEFSLNTQNINSDSFSWNTSFNISFLKNKILGINYVPVYDVASIETVGETAVRFTPGVAVGSFFGYKVDGVDPSTGNIKYKDLDGDGNLHSDIDPDDRTFIGNPNPKFTAGLTNHFKYKNAYLDVLLTASYGNDIFNASRLDLELMNDFKNQSTAVLNRWTTPGQITNVPKANDPNAMHISDRFVEDGSYLKLKSVTLGYNFKNLFKGISNVSAYITGQNLLTWTKYSGFDPEVNAFSSSPGIIGVDYGTYPQVRTFIFGIKTTF